MSPPHSINHSQATCSYSEPLLVHSPILSPTSYPGFSFLASPGGFPSAKSGLDKSTHDTRGAQSSTNLQQPSDSPTADQLLEGGIPRAAVSLTEVIARASAAHERKQSEKQDQQPAPVSLAAMQLRRGKKLCDPVLNGSDERTQPIMSRPGVVQRVPEPTVKQSATAQRLNRPSQSNKGTITPAPFHKKHSTSDTSLEPITQNHAEVDEEDSPFGVNSEALSVMKATMRPTDYKQFMKRYQDRLAEEQPNVADLDDGIMGLLDLEMRILEEVKQEWETQERSRRATPTTNLADSLKTVTLSSDQPVRKQSVYNTNSKNQSCPCGSEPCWALEHFNEVPQGSFQSIENGNTGAVVSLNAEKYAEYAFKQAAKNASKDRP